MNGAGSPLKFPCSAISLRRLQETGPAARASAPPTLIPRGRSLRKLAPWRSHCRPHVDRLVSTAETTARMSVLLRQNLGA